MSEYIRKEDAVDAVEYANGNMTWAERDDCKKRLEELSPADVALMVHGKWINEYWHGETVRKCSVCKITQTVNVYNGEVKFNYCPYCGARMDEEEMKE